jgi:prepilin-type N-terminal cleavage/methylation domain-containing protein
MGLAKVLKCVPDCGGAMTENKGFSLLELLIVVAIILIIATIAIPSLLRSRQAASEATAVGTLRTINTAQVTYLSSSGGAYGTLPDLVSSGLLDSRFSGGTISGYSYGLETDTGTYTATATPISTNSGRYGYYSGPDGVVRYQTATSTNCNPCFPPSQAGIPVQ